MPWSHGATLTKILDIQLPEKFMPQFSETARAGLELMAEDYYTRKRTIVRSDATHAAKTYLMDMLGLPEIGASWLNKPYLSEAVGGYSWLKATKIVSKIEPG